MVAFKSSFTFEMDGINKHEKQIGRQSREKVSYLSFSRALDPRVYLLQTLQDFWF